MTHARLLPVLALALALSGCDRSAPTAPPPPATAAPAPMPIRLALSGDGLIAVMADTGATQPLPFLRPKGQTLVTMTRAELTRGKESVNRECGAGPLTFVEWPDGLSLMFQDDRFVGWTADERGAGSLTFMNGVGIGSSRAELVAAFPGTKVEETTLGVEFTLPGDGRTGGLLNGRDQAAKVTDLWAGVTCMFR
jgi:hypothetical protein